MSSAFHEVLRGVAMALAGVGEGWYVFGAQAAILRGSRRMTADLDITLLPGVVGSPELLARLESCGFAAGVEHPHALAQQARVLPVVHHDTGMPVDIVLGGPGLEALFLAESELISVAGIELRVPKVEHLVVMKLIAGRAHDLDDAQAMMLANDADMSAIESLVEAIAVGLGEDDVKEALASLRRRMP